MIDLPEIEHFYICQELVDGRKGLPGLTEMVLSYDKDPADNSAYAFISKSRKLLKVVFHDATGFILLYKKITKGCFSDDIREPGMNEIDRNQFNWAMQGISIYAWSSSNHKVLI